jgi:hypothetical protein
MMSEPNFITDFMLIINLQNIRISTPSNTTDANYMLYCGNMF